MLDTESIKNLLVAAVPDLLAKGQFQNRNLVIGASEVGMCMRLVVHRKLNETAVDPGSAGRMLRGTALENACVQIIREAFSTGAVKATGANQKELHHATLPLVCHPDGELTLDKKRYALEIKTADPNAFRSYTKNGLKIWYEDQATVQAGLGGNMDGTLLVLVDSSNLGNIQPFHIPFDRGRYLAMEARAATMAHHLAEQTLPEGEPDRSWGCSKCPLRGDCAAFTLRMATPAADGPDPVLVADLTALLDDIKALEDQITEPSEELEACKKQLKEVLANNGLAEFRAGTYRVTVTTSVKDSFDTKSFKAANPETYAKFVKATQTLTMRFNWGA